MKKWAAAVSAVIIVFLAAYMFRDDNARPDLENIKTAAVEKDDMRITVGATGVVTPYIKVEVKSKAGGEIISFSFEEGDRLRKGETAVRLDPETERSRVNQARADLLSAEAAVEKAKITLRDQELKLGRQQSLFGDKVVSRQDLDNALISVEKAKSDVKSAEAGLIRAEEALKEAEDRLEDTEIKAPLAGTILKKYAEEGQVIASTTSSVSEGTLIFTMADLDRLYIKALVDETDIGRVRPGQSAAVTVDAYPSRTFSGNVVRIAPQGEVDSTITVFEVIIEIADSDKSMLRPVMTANAEILTSLREGVLIVPSEAVRAREDETGVYKIVDGGLLWIPVSPGMSNGTHTEIKGDIHEGEEVLLSGLKENMLPLVSNDKRGRGFRFFGRRK